LRLFLSDNIFVINILITKQLKKNYKKNYNFVFSNAKKKLHLRISKANFMVDYLKKTATNLIQKLKDKIAILYNNQK